MRCKRPRTFRLFVLCLLVGSLYANGHEGRKPPSGPVYVPLDSWVYPALKRLAALGYAPDLDGLVAPWTRSQCTVLVEEAEDIVSRYSDKASAPKTNAEAVQLLSALEQEFLSSAPARTEARVESIYTRFGEISGEPLRDSYHFGQTLADDFARPYASGPNLMAGFSAFGNAGRFSGYFRGEYQQAGSSAGYPASLRTQIGQIDGVPPQPAGDVPPVSRFVPLEMYVGAALGSFNITVGKQSMWWGPGENSAFAFTDNAAPLYSMRIDQERPIILPGPFRFLGHIRTQFLVGRLSGHQFPPGPWINAQKITFQLTKDFELGFTRSAIFGGAGHPLTASSILKSFLSGSSTGGTAFGSANDPGDRRSGFDFKWRVPGLRRYLTVYSDSLADDEPNPLDAPRRSAWGPGIYVAQIPGLRRADFRFETYSTLLYRGDAGGGFFYWNDQYRDAYTNDGFLLGSWVGRDARAYEGSVSYWRTSQNKLSFSFRQIKTGGNFLPGGGTQTDVTVSGQWRLRPGWQATASVQYERYFIPVLGPPHTDVSGNLQFTFYPKHWVIRK